PQRCLRDYLPQGIVEIVTVGRYPCDRLLFAGNDRLDHKLRRSPSALWTLPYPLILNNTPASRLQNNGYCFTLSWATKASVVVEVSPYLKNPKWSPLTTNALSGGTFYFSDPQWTNYPSRFYRVRSQ